MKNFKAVLVSMLVLASGYSSAMDLEVRDYSDGTQYLSAEGKIVSGDYERLLKVLGNNPDVLDIYLDSPGGRVDISHKMGRLIRDEGLNTVVTNKSECQSACVDVFLGGVERFWEEGEDDLRLGFHAAFAENMKEESPELILEYGQFYAAVDIAYCVEMIPDENIRPFLAFYVDVHNREDSSKMMWPSLEEMLETGIVTLSF